MASPFDRIPENVLLSIVLYALGTVAAILPPPRYQDNARLSMSHVCSRWFNLVLRTRTLWNTYRFYPIWRHNPERLVELINLWLSRSEDNCIHIQFINRPSTSLPNLGPRPTSAYDIMYGGRTINIINYILVKVSPRIRSFILTVCAEDFIKAFIDIPREPFPMLEVVSITLTHDVDQSKMSFTVQEFTNSFTVFQDLHRLRIASIHLLNGIHPLAIRFPWAQLTSVDFMATTTSPEIFMMIVELSPSLIEGQFNIGFTCPNTLDREYLGACGRSMQILTLRLIDPSLDTRMFDNLSLPAIRQLRIDLYDPSRSWDTSIIASMLKDSAATLQYLMLANYPPPLSSPNNLDFTQICKVKGTFYTDLELLFIGTPSLRGLYLPFSLPIHCVTLEKIANGELLPRLEALSLCRSHGLRALSALQGRNNNHQYSLLQPGNSAVPDRRPKLSPLSSLILAVPAGEAEQINHEWQSLQALPYMRSTVAEFFGENMRYFKFYAPLNL